MALYCFAALRPPQRQRTPPATILMAHLSQMICPALIRVADAALRDGSALETGYATFRQMAVLSVIRVPTISGDLVARTGVLQVGCQCRRYTYRLLTCARKQFQSNRKHEALRLLRLLLWFRLLRRCCYRQNPSRTSVFHHHSRRNSSFMDVCAREHGISLCCLKGFS